MPQTDVLIIGYGPTGATLAALLGRLGVSVLVVERGERMHDLPRAVHFDSEVMRIFQSLGIARTLHPHVVETPAYAFQTAAGAELFSIQPQARTSNGWAGGYMFHQPGLESVLRGAVAACPEVEVWTRHVFAGLEQREGWVEAAIQGPGGSVTVQASFVVGCDGGGSVVREAVRIGLEDMAFDEEWLVVDVVLGPQSRVPAINIQRCDPARPTTCVISGPGRHRWEFMLMPGESAASVLAPGFAEGLIAGWSQDDGLRLERRAVYRFHGLIARAWRAGRVFLAGDAAHQMPPMAGQGMCAGIRDAYNLAWKLACVLGGAASQTLLDSYEAERAPHAREVIETAIALGRVVCTTDPAVAAARDAEMLAARAAGSPGPGLSFSPFGAGLLLAETQGAGTLLPQPVAEDDAVRLDDVLGPGACLLTDEAGSVGVEGTVRRRSLAEPALAPFAASLREWLRRHHAPAVLVRPDRVVFATGEADRLALAYQAALAGTAPRASAG